jgi:hypothetical protein
MVQRVVAYLNFVAFASFQLRSFESSVGFVIGLLNLVIEFDSFEGYPSESVKRSGPMSLMLLHFIVPFISIVNFDDCFSLYCLR